jgi:hypothetical protein
MKDCATRRMRFETHAALAVVAAFDGGRITSDGGLLWLAEMDSELEGHLTRFSREQTRLVDAYHAQIIELDELEERRSKIAQRRNALRTQYEQQPDCGDRQKGRGRC